MEFIPDKDNLYLRVCAFHFDRNGNIQNEAFEPRKPRRQHERDDCGKKSVDWNRYSTPLDTISRTEVNQCKNCCSLKVSIVRDAALLVEYLPTIDNPAHALYHSCIPLIEPRPACVDKPLFEQPSDGQLDALRINAKLEILNV